jgi:hypothetical protein
MRPPDKFPVHSVLSSQCPPPSLAPSYPILREKSGASYKQIGALRDNGFGPPGYLK